jgi:hypothetical protein
LTTNIKVEGVKELIERFNDPRLIKEPLRELLIEASDIGKQTAAGVLDVGVGTQSFKGQGGAKFSIVTAINAQSMTATVKTLMPTARAMSIEKGRPTGEAPPIKQIAAWAKFNRIADHPRAVAARIQQAGVKGKFYMKQAREAVQNALPAMLAEMARKVEARFKQ